MFFLLILFVSLFLLFLFYIDFCFGTITNNNILFGLYLPSKKNVKNEIIHMSENFIFLATIIFSMHLSSFILLVFYFNHFTFFTSFLFSFSYNFIMTIVRSTYSYNFKRYKVKEGLMLSDDYVWVFGAYYLNPFDHRLHVPSRYKLGTAYNLSKPLGKILVGTYYFVLCLILQYSYLISY